MKYILGPEAQRLATIAGGVDQRAILQCVQIGKGEAIATDGYMMARCAIEGDGPAVNVLAKDILGLKPDLDANLTVETENKQITLKGQAVVVSRLEDGPFPQTDGVYPKTAVKATISLTAKLMRKLLALTDPGKEEMITFWVRGPQEAMTFRIGRDDEYSITGLLMPMAPLGTLPEFFPGPSQVDDEAAHLVIKMPRSLHCAK